MTNLNVNVDRELGWDDVIEIDNEYIILPEGDYDFKVESFERGRHGGSEKLPPCNKAVVTLKVFGPNGQEATIFHNLFLHTSTEGMLSAFFSGIGLKKKGEPLRMNWNQVVGRMGRAKITNREYNGNTYNQVSKFYPADEPQQKSFTAGKF